MIDDLTTSKFLDALASGNATPGGGSAAAIMGAMGAALMSMVANLTIGKKGYEAVETEMRELLAESRGAARPPDRHGGRRRGGLRHADGRLQAAEGDRRREGARAASPSRYGLKRATEAPLACARACAEAVRLTERAVEHGNLNVISDVGVGVVAAWAALRSAALNVHINAPQMKRPRLRGPRPDGKRGAARRVWRPDRAHLARVTASLG